MRFTPKSPTRFQEEPELLIRIHKRIPVLVDEVNNVNPLRTRYSRGHLNSSTNSNLFSKNVFESIKDAGMVDNAGRWNAEEIRPLVEGKLIGILNHRFGTFLGVNRASRFGKKAEAREPTLAEMCDPYFRSMPRFWLKASDAQELISAKCYSTNWLVTYRHVCRAIVDARTAQVCISPNEITSDSCAILLFDDEPKAATSAACLIVAAWDSFVGDYIIRQKIYGPALTKALSYQLPTLNPKIFDIKYNNILNIQYLKERVLELSYTAWDLEQFGKDCGWSGPPFRWDEERRFFLRCELDAAIFHLYLSANREGEWQLTEGETGEEVIGLKACFPTPRNAVAYIMDTFPIVRRRDEETYNGDYRTKRVILEIYDAVQESIRTGRSYQTRLNPPAGPPAYQLPDWPAGAPRPQNWPSHIHEPKR